MKWHECFETGEINFEDSKNGRGEAIATGLCGWAMCMSGNKPPENFGKTMVEIGRFVGCSSSPDGLSKAADEFLI